MQTSAIILWNLHNLEIQKGENTALSANSDAKSSERETSFEAAVKIKPSPTNCHGRMAGSGGKLKVLGKYT
nr:hypothetical transcript [Hymenolepis microstoma]